MKIEVRAAGRRAVGALLPLIAIVVLLSGCEQKVELQLVPDARRASEIAAALSSHGIVVARKPEKSGVMLSVESADFPRAMRALREAGLLRSARPGVDEALGKRGIAPTQLEERARHIHAIERELESTLMEIDGVIAARVSVVPPERPAPGAALASASASVFVKHSADVDLSPLVPGIARLVKNGVPGLAVEDDRHVTVMLVPEQRAAIAYATAPAGAAGPSVRTMMQLALLVAGSMTAGLFLDRGVRRLRQRAVHRSTDDGAGNT
jgi:type III secretion protein J